MKGEGRVNVQHTILKKRHPNVLPSTIIQSIPRNRLDRFNSPLHVLLQSSLIVDRLLLRLGQATRQSRIGRVELCDSVVESSVRFGEGCELSLEGC